MPVPARPVAAERWSSRQWENQGVPARPLAVEAGPGPGDTSAPSAPYTACTAPRRELLGRMPGPFRMPPLKAASGRPISWPLRRVL